MTFLFISGVQEGLTAADSEIAQWLRREHSDKPITLAVNKCESPIRGQLQASEFWPLG
jgi:predicted GTPase